VGVERFRLLIGNKNYSSWSLRPWLLLRVAGVPFEEELLPFHLEGWKERVRAVNPAGQVPALVHERADGTRSVVWESLAICDYAARIRPEARLWPDEDPSALAMCLSVSAEMHAGFRRLRESMPMNVRKSLPGRGRQPGVAEDIARVAAIWGEAQQRFGAGGPFLFGRFSVADAMYAPVVYRFATYAVELDGACAAYRDHMLGLPAMREWAAASAAEPWVERHDEVE
jgi:glutathione S-transferase